MKRHPSSWSIVFAAPKNDARILRKSERKSPRESLPFVHAEDHEVDALLASLDETPAPEPESRADDGYDPELHIPTVPIAFRVPKPAMAPPRPRHEPVLAKVLVDDALLVPAPVKRKRRELDETQVSMRKCQETMALLATARPLVATPPPPHRPAAILFGFCAFAVGIGSVVVAIVTSAGTM